MKRSRPSPSSILQQVRQLRAQPVQAELAKILDDLDAWTAVEAALARYSRLIAWGPKTVKGDTPSPWVGVIMWRRASGYTGYRTLSLSGVWTVQEAHVVRIIMGQRTLPYAAPFYEAEVYHKLMRKDFTVYYDDNGAPPAPLLRSLDVTYDLQARLALRETILQVLSAQ
ncbi:MAG: hypothetical protein KJ065_17675 [Anaerolineae bacterium]|nr:hypothetical protein [Anaerolineae bacterium]